MKKQLLLLAILIFNVTILHAQSELWGMALKGGNGEGIIFKTDQNGNNQKVVKKFDVDYPGKYPEYSELCQASNGKLYGLTASGGTYNCGVIFEFDPATYTYAKKVDFTGTMNGTSPDGSLIQGSNGKLYGMTSGGGAYQRGVLFEFDPTTSTYTKKIDFAGTSNGTSPTGSLMQASNGKLYGMTIYGGANNYGVIFEYDIVNSTCIKKFDFDGSLNGSNPYGTLMQAANGKLFGMTANGGTYNYGVIFEFDFITSTCNKKFDFAGYKNGRNPYGSLMQATNGKLYGMTYTGGANNKGVLFEYDTATSTYTIKLDFAGTANGSNPYGSLMQASNGKLYGMTRYGGAYAGIGFGVLFEYDLATSTYIKKIDFADTLNGKEPHGSLIQASNGKLYGMTSYGGRNKYGVLFEYDPSNSKLTKKFDFTVTLSGSQPNGSLVHTTNGKLYGLTSNGGTDNKGVLFEFDTTNSKFTKKIDFNGTLNGSTPLGSLMLASNGKLYGMTKSGGVNDDGVLFEFDPSTSIFIKKIDFSDTLTGREPLASLIQASNGNLYGMTSRGGAYDMGVIFEYDPKTSKLDKKFDFIGNLEGQQPLGSLMQASNGKLYGMTTYGGTNNQGVIFEFDPSTYTCIKKIDFPGLANVCITSGALIQASNGKLYGMTNSGGNSMLGSLFEYDIITSIFTKKIDFGIDINGTKPLGSLIQASNGKLYGMTPVGGTYQLGVLFEYDIATSTINKKLDFNSINGSTPNGDLIILAPCTPPVIITHPYKRSKCVGDSVNFNIVDYATCSRSYQWQKNGIDINGAITPNYSISNTTPTDSGNYTCVVSTSVGNVISNAARLDILPQPVVSFSINETKQCFNGNYFEFNNTSSISSGSMNYQWDLGDGTISSTTSQTHSYSTSANYKVKLKAVSSMNCKDSITQNIYIQNNPTTYLGKDTIINSKQSLTLIAGNGFDHYLWSNNDTTKQITVDSAKYGLGTKTFWLKVSQNECDGYDTIQVTIAQYTSIDVLKSGFNAKIYPNPVNSIVHIELSTVGKGLLIELTDMNGKIIKTFNIQSDPSDLSYSINVSEFPDGIYFMHISNSEFSSVYKIVKY